MKAARFLSLLPMLGVAWADLPQNLNGKQLQFSHCPSYKFTPLLIRFGQSAGGNAYAVSSENGRNYQVQYTPDKASNTAILRVQGPNNKATINMRFETDVFGTATMSWNGIPYYALTFRLTESTSDNTFLSRMGDPVGDVIPRSVGGNTLEVNFDGAVEQVFNSEGNITAENPSRLTSLLIRFPNGQNSFTGTLGDGTEATVEFEHMGCGARIGLSGNRLNAELMLDFADSCSGTATLEKFATDSTHLIRGATFRLIPTSENSTPPVNETDNGLAQLIEELRLQRYPTAVERLYQKRLLTLLPRILAGESVNTTLPRENNTTALHNACGLSHVKIVQWLVEHGADIHARTAKRADVADCVGGRHAAAIHALLRKAK